MKAVIFIITHCTHTYRCTIRATLNQSTLVFHRYINVKNLSNIVKLWKKNIKRIVTRSFLLAISLLRCIGNRIECRVTFYARISYKFSLNNSFLVRSWYFNVYNEVFMHLARIFFHNAKLICNMIG